VEETGEMVAEFRGKTGENKQIAVSPVGARIVTAASDGFVKVWDASPFAEPVVPPDE
jgi:WD40 repeat protein